jgi:hypothetical protein
MKTFRAIVARIRLFPVVTPRPLGRWALEYRPDMLNRKIDSSNEDHCGPCGLPTKTSDDGEKKRINPVHKFLYSQIVYEDTEKYYEKKTSSKNTETWKIKKAN